jgi:excisionase family DNA binding protein
MDTINSKTFSRRESASTNKAAICVRRIQAAEMLSISVSTLDRLVKAGEIPCFKLSGSVLFRVAALTEWAHRCERDVIRVARTPTQVRSQAMKMDGEATPQSSEHRHKH